jgi:hypothetical protein
MVMIRLQSGMRKDRLDRFSEALGVIREGRGPLEAAVLSSLQKWPRLVPMLRRRFMGPQDAVLLILDHPHTVVRAQRRVAVHRTLRYGGEGQQWLQHFLGSRSVRAQVIHPAFDR